MKARAALIAICRVEKVEDVAGAMKPQGVAVLTLVKVLHPAWHSPVQPRVMFDKPPDPGAPLAHEQFVDAQPVVGETALVFLQSARRDTYRVILGTHGYIPLETRTKEQQTRVVKLLEQYHGRSGKIADEKGRKLMDDCYRKALDYVRKQNGRRP